MIQIFNAFYILFRPPFVSIHRITELIDTYLDNVIYYSEYQLNLNVLMLSLMLPKRSADVSNNLHLNCIIMQR